jgi:hypothetical protein
MSVQATNQNLIPCPPGRCVGTGLTETCQHRMIQVISGYFLRAFTKLRKEIISLIMSLSVSLAVCLSFSLSVCMFGCY